MNVFTKCKDIFTQHKDIYLHTNINFKLLNHSLSKTAILSNYEFSSTLFLRNQYSLPFIDLPTLDILQKRVIQSVSFS